MFVVLAVSFFVKSALEIIDSLAYEWEGTDIEESEAEREKRLQNAVVVLHAAGSSVPGCEETNGCFLPYDLETYVLTTVSWKNVDDVPHAVTSRTSEAYTLGVFDSGLILPGSTFEFKFGREGTFDYFCSIHPWMVGVVHVVSEPPSPPRT